jgi:hypothetical protein
MPDRDDKGDDLADRMSRRFGGEPTSEDDSAQTTSTASSAQESKTPKGSKREETQKSDAVDSGAETAANVSDRPSVLMYLPEEQRRALDLRFDELNLKHKREHGDALQKNRDYYPAVIEAALSDRSLEEILLED